MIQARDKELYETPELETFALTLEAPVAQSQTEPVEDDPTEHDW